MFDRSPSKEDLLCEMYYYIPNARARKRMSILELADLAAKPALMQAARLVVEHELSIRLAKVQSNATYWAAGFGLVGVLFGWLLSWLSQQHQTTVVRCECESRAESTQQGPVANPKPPAQPLIVQPSKAPNVGNSGGSTQNNRTNAKP